MVVRRPDVICLSYVAWMLINYEELAYLGELLGVNFKYFYCINCSAIQGFPILRKALSTHEKYDNFTCVWYRQSAAYTSLASSTPWIPSSFSIEASLSKFLRLGSWLLKYWKIVMANGGRQPKYEKKTESYIISGFANGISHGWKRKSTTGRFATKPILAVYLKRSFNIQYLRTL